MNKKELIWREILMQVLDQKVYQFTQKKLAGKLGVSLSTVFNALKAPRQSNIVQVTGRNFRVRDPERFLVLWGTARNISADKIYEN